MYKIITIKKRLRLYLLGMCFNWISTKGLRNIYNAAKLFDCSVCLES